MAGLPDLESFSSEVEFYLSGVFPDLDRMYRGHEGIQELNDQLNAPWEEFSLEPDRFIDIGERVLVLSHSHGRGRDGIKVRLPSPICGRCGTAKRCEWTPSRIIKKHSKPSG